MALTAIHSILQLLDLGFSRKKLDGVASIGVGDGSGDLSGRVVDVSRRPSRVNRVHSGDSWIETFSAYFPDWLGSSNIEGTIVRYHEIFN